MQSVFCAAAVLLTGLLPAGCKTADVKMPAKFKSVPDARVILAPGDMVDVKFFYTPELNESQQIRPDGKISLQLVGDVAAAGLTPSALKDDLEKKYAGLIEKPSVVVIVRELNHRNVYVGGAVHKPGMVEMPGNMTALNAIIQAGDFNLREASLENVIVIRQDGATRKVFTLDFKDELKGCPRQDPFYLHAQDIVYVPRTKIANAVQWVDQHINKIVPQFGGAYENAALGAYVTSIGNLLVPPVNGVLAEPAEARKHRPERANP